MLQQLIYLTSFPTIYSQLKLNKDELKRSDRSEKLELLRANLPKEGGNSNKYNVRNIQEFICPVPLESTVQEDIIPAAEITLYIVGINALEVDLLVRLFRCIPSRVFVMKSTDFFLPSERKNLRLKVDRVAALRGAAHIHGFPAIVFDVGDEISCIAANLNGRLIGESVTSGLWQRLQCLIGINSDLRTLTRDTVDKEFDVVIKNKKPLPLFANNNEKSAIATAMSEVSNHARYLHKIWMKKFGPPTPVGDGRRDPLTFCKVNYKRTGSVIGSDKRLLLTLLKENQGGLIECPGKLDKISMIHFPELISRGIHNTILRMKHIMVEKDESFLEEYVVAKTWKRIKPETTPASSHTKSIGTNKKRLSEEMSDEGHEELQKNISSKWCKRGELLSSTEKNSSKDKKNSSKKKKNSLKDKKQNSDDDKKRNRKNERKCELRAIKSKAISILDENPERQKGKKVKKYFEDVLYSGKVVSVNQDLKRKLWHVEYSDSDSEDFDKHDLHKGLKLCAKIEKKEVDLS